MGILKVNTTLCEIKNCINGNNGHLDTTGDTSNKLENQSREIIQIEVPRKKKRLKKMNGSQCPPVQCKVIK